MKGGTEMKYGGLNHLSQEITDEFRNLPPIVIQTQCAGSKLGGREREALATHTQTDKTNGVISSWWLPDGVMHDLAQIHDSVDDEWVAGPLHLLPAHTHRHCVSLVYWERSPPQG